LYILPTKHAHNSIFSLPALYIPQPSSFPRLIYCTHS
jgi:hypothetical protein